MNKPTALECKNCGAALHDNQRECKYCGTEYRWSNDGPYVGPPLTQGVGWQDTLDHRIMWASSCAYGTANFVASEPGPYPDYADA